MIYTQSVLQSGAEILAVLVTGYFAAEMWRRRTEPTARFLLAVAFVMFAGMLGHSAVIRPTPVGRALSAFVWADAGGPLWFAVLGVIVPLAGGFWFLFTLQYTGRGGQLVAPAAAAIGVFWLFLIGLALFGNFSPPSDVQAQSSVEVAIFLGAYLTSVVIVVGVLLVVTTSLERNAVRLREALALAAGGSLLAFIPIVSDTLVRPNVVPVMLTLASAAFVVSVRRYPTFEAPPVARIAGRDRLIEEMDDPFVVIDRDGRIRDLNPASERYFDADGEVVLGEPLDALLPTAIDPGEVAAADGPVHLRTSAGATLACTVNQISDARDRSFGHLLVFQDVTERQRRERRLGVLNQLLTGAVSDRMQSVADDAASIPARSGDEPAESVTADVGRSIHAETTRLLDLVAWTREIERTLAQADAGPVAVVPAVREVLDAVTTPENVALEFTSDDAVSPAAMDEAVLETVVEVLLADALEHAHDAVRVGAVETDHGPAVHVVDDRTTSSARRPADDADADADAVRSRSELVVEMVRLAARQVGGDVTTRASETGARRVVLQLPGLDDGADERVAVLSDERTDTEGHGRQVGERP